MSVLDDIPEPIRSIVEARAHELYHERESADDRGFSDSMKIARFVEDLNPEQLITLREVINVSSDPTRQSMIYGLITGSLIYKHGLNWEGKSAEEELLGHHEGEIKADEVDWNKHIDTLPTETPSAAWKVKEEVEDERGPAPDQAWERVLNIPAADRGKWTENEYMNLLGVYEVFVENGNMNCTGCGVFVHSLTDRMLLEPGVEGCKSCQKKTKWG